MNVFVARTAELGEEQGTLLCGNRGRDVKIVIIFAEIT